jgi:hypothetical protein
MICCWCVALQASCSLWIGRRWYSLWRDLAQLKSVMEAVNNSLTGTGICLPSCWNLCKVLERGLKSDTEWWCMDFAVHPRSVPIWHSVQEYYIVSVKSLCVTSHNQSRGRGTMIKNAVKFHCKRSSLMALDDVMQLQISAAHSVFGMTAVKLNMNRLRG